MKHHVLFLSIGLLIGASIMWSLSNCSSFMGKEIAYTSGGMDAGIFAITLYDHGICKLEYGGIFGITDTKYFGYCLLKDRIQIQTNENIGDISYLKIELQGRSLQISNVER
ncbi:MAG: hypothetical protein AAFY71_02740 [Bacteroidota bacterium]